MSANESAKPSCILGFHTTWQINRIRPTLSQKLFQCLTLNFSNLAYFHFFPISNSHSVTVFHFRSSRPAKWCSISSFWVTSGTHGLLVTCTAICKERWKKNTAFQRLISFEFHDYKRKQWFCLSQSCACTEFKFPYF